MKRILFVGLLCILLAARISYSQSATAIATVNVTPWNLTGIVYPEGLFELSGIYPKPVTIDNFTIGFVNFTASAGSNLSCTIVRSDGSLLILNKTINSNITNGHEQLSYKLQTGDPSGAYERSWYIDKCELKDPVYGYRLNDTDYPVYSKTDLWYFVVGGVFKSNDAANAYISKVARARAYFGHDDASDYDIIFAVLKYSGTHLFEGNCTDGLDNDGDGQIDCADSDCKTIFWTACGHTLKPGGPGQFAQFSLPPQTQSCAGNICRLSVGGADVWYTQSAAPDGQLKVKVERNIPSPEIVFVILKNNTQNAIEFQDPKTNLYGPNPLPYKWLLPSDGPPYYTFTASSKRNASSTETFSGFLRMVMNTTLPNAADLTYNMSLDLYVGSAQGTKAFLFYVDADAPHNRFENDTKLSHVTSHYISGTAKTLDQACNDGIDNDLGYDGVDCADPDCTGIQIGVTLAGDPIRCESPERTCWDNFDNDGDGAVDCEDPDCNAQLAGWLLPNGTFAKWRAQGKMAFCDAPEGSQFYIPPNSSVLSSCADSFDNDAEDGVDCYDVSNCWGRGLKNTSYPCPMFENNDPSWCSDRIDNDYDEYVHADIRAGYTTGVGIDCDDYDCAGNPACPAAEDLDAHGNYAPWQCFDGIDNDLDAWYWNGSAYVQNPATGKDCADPDCAGAVNPLNASEFCSATEFNLARFGFSDFSYNYCGNSRDDDADAGDFRGGSDCLDANSSLGDWTDCWKRFGNCGPCPSVENISWSACADGLNNDFDDGSGGYSNSDGKDCADSDCNNEIGSLDSSQKCEYSKELTCDDGFDNDADGAVDCADADCDGAQGPGGICGPENCTDDFDNDGDRAIDCIDSDCWGTACAPGFSSGICLTIPSYTTKVLEPAQDIRITYKKALHAYPDNWTIRFTNVQSIAGSSIIIVLGQYPSAPTPFNVTASQIVLSGPSAAHFSMDWTDHVLTLQNNSPISDLDLTITIPNNVSLNSYIFPILTQSEHGQGNDNIAFTAYEDRPPVISSIEVEPLTAGIANIRLGDSIYVRAYPNDSASGNSGICGCYFQKDGSAPVFESDCVYEFTPTREGLVNITVWAVDTPANQGPANSSLFTVNIAPTVRATELQGVFHRRGLAQLNFSASFETAASDSWQGCSLLITNSSGALVYTDSLTNKGSGSLANCTARLALPDSILSKDGIYFVYANATDSDGSQIKSKRKLFFVCNNLSSSGAAFDGTVWNCARADWDGDGVTDGYTTNLWTENISQPCDNCLELYNPDQSDSDLDGVGDVCDNCWYVYNPDQADSNANCPGKPYTNDPKCGDACEVVRPAYPPGYPIPKYFVNITQPEYDLGDMIELVYKIENPLARKLDVHIVAVITHDGKVFWHSPKDVSVKAYSTKQWTEPVARVRCDTPYGKYSVHVEWWQKERKVQENDLAFNVISRCKAAKLYLSTKKFFYLPNESLVVNITAVNTGNIDLARAEIFARADHEHFYKQTDLNTSQSKSFIWAVDLRNFTVGVHKVNATIWHEGKLLDKAELTFILVSPLVITFIPLIGLLILIIFILWKRRKKKSVS